MNEQEAREIIELHKHLDEAINDPRLHSSMDKAIHAYLTAKGFLAGIEAERERVRPLIAVAKHYHDTECPVKPEEHGIPGLYMCHWEEAFAAYTQPEGKEKL